MARSFIENVNIIANATVLAEGDVLDDATRARDEAEVFADNAETSATAADMSEAMALDWATKAYNDQVRLNPGTGLPEYSSYHWSVQSNLNSATELINDAVTSLSSTWSSSALTALAAEKAAVGHNHDGIYDTYVNPASRNTAYDKDFTTSGGNFGTGIEVARGDHLHTGIYEPLINSGLDKLTAFNKDFGITANTVAEGDHNHDLTYMAIATYADGNLIKPTSIPWTINENDLLSTEVPRATHRHNADKIDYTSVPGDLLTAPTVQGALGEANSIFESLSISARCSLVGGSSASATVDITTAGTYEPILISFDSSTSASNCQYNDGLQIYYNDPGNNPGEEGTKLIEGMWSATVSLLPTAVNEYSITCLLKPEATGVWEVMNDNFSVEVGDFLSGDDMSIAIPITGWVSGLAENDIIGIGITSTAVELIDITGITMTFSGAQDGALVASGSTINHADLLGLGGAGVHIITDIDGLDTALGLKADKIVPSVPGNLASLNSFGNLEDSGVTLTDISDKMDKIAAPTLNNIILMDGGGNSLNSGAQLTDYANVGGDTAQVFKVGASVSDEDAIRKLEVTTLLTNYTTTATYSAHIAATNPHGVTYTETGAAAASHTHPISDITLLNDALLAKYSVVAGQVSDNIPAFDDGGILQDSGISMTYLNARIAADDYATDLIGGTIKILQTGTDCYITTDGSTPGP